MNTQEMTNEELANAAVMYYSIAANDNGSYNYLMTMLEGKFGERVDVEDLVSHIENEMRSFIKEKLDETDEANGFDFNN
jgi:negative regulator of sigma E activity